MSDGLLPEVNKLYPVDGHENLKFKFCAIEINHQAMTVTGKLFCTMPSSLVLIEISVEEEGKVSLFRTADMNQDIAYIVSNRDLTILNGQWKLVVKEIALYLNSGD